jgi:hypothetical protein
VPLQYNISTIARFGFGSVTVGECGWGGALSAPIRKKGPKPLLDESPFLMLVAAIAAVVSITSTHGITSTHAISVTTDTVAVPTIDGGSTDTTTRAANQSDVLNV